MSRQTVVLTCRLVSLWFFFNAFLTVFGMLRSIFPPLLYLLHTSRTGLAPGQIASQIVGLSLIEALLEFAVGMFFYRCDPNAVRFLFDSTAEESNLEPPTEQLPE